MISCFASIEIDASNLTYSEYKCNSIVEKHSLTLMHSSRASSCRSLRPGRLQQPLGAVAYSVGGAVAHNKDGHPEGAARVLAVDRALKHWLDQNPQSPVLLLPNTTTASRACLELVHPKGYVNKLIKLSDSLQAPVLLDDSTYLAPGSMDAVSHAVGGTLSLLDHVMATNSTGFSICRPPGHHVLPTRPMGFGIVNTVSVVVKHALKQHGVQRCLIFDFDVHHGNGTEDIFYDDPSVLYISCHQAGLWPYTGKLSSTGRGAGAGATINIPLPGGSGDEVMRQVVSKVLWPAALRFKPDLIVVSAGYDAHWADPLASMQLRTSTYRCLGQQLAILANACCQGRLLLVLEGGYHVDSLGASVVSTFKGLLDGCSSQGFEALWPTAEQDRLAGLDDDEVRDAMVWLPDEPLEKAAQVIAQVCEQHKLQAK